jgi:hypothetical protein
MPTKLIFEAETALGLCDPDRVNSHFGDHSGAWTAFANTTAILTGAKGVLRIEQRCYLRAKENPEDIRSQTWVPSEMTFEPVAAGKSETGEMVQALHDSFVEKARGQLKDQLLFNAPEPPCEDIPAEIGGNHHARLSRSSKAW